ncbi:AraC family transcriptional regulator [Paenibacillus sp. GCM10027626]|uniref:AraC family transcriptional regulator n=1 Tax=Paenibacillus sp. GCM10027626 TaxID=3273411 RepID=UPI0036343807
MDVVTGSRSTEQLHFFVRFVNRLICSGGESFGPRIIHDHQFIYVERGCGKAEIAGQSYEVEPGQLYYYGPGEPHWFRADDRDPFVLYGLHFSAFVKPGEEHRLKRGIVTIDQVDDCREVRELPGAEPRFPGLAAYCHTGGWPRALLQEIVAEYRKNDSYSPLILQGIMAELIGRLQRTVTANERAADPRQAHMAAIKQKLEEHAGASYCPDWLARWSPYGHDYASRLFRSTYGEAPHAYHLARKLELSQVMLQESGQSVTEIASQLHFNSVHYFSRLFKARYGESPSAYRNRHRML